MRRNKRLWKIMGSALGWTLLSILMAGVQPGHALTPLPPFHTRCGFTRWNAAELRSNLGNTAEIRPESAFTPPILPFGKYHAAGGFLTLAELEKLLRHRIAERTLHQLRAASQLLLTPKTLELPLLFQAQAAIVENSITSEKTSHENFGYVRTSLPPKQHLQELQSFRI